jgi:hypothetical protein
MHFTGPTVFSPFLAAAGCLSFTLGLFFTIPAWKSAWRLRYIPAQIVSTLFLLWLALPVVSFLMAALIESRADISGMLLSFYQFGPLVAAIFAVPTIVHGWRRKKHSVVHRLGCGLTHETGQAEQQL